ncbi:MAG TPA: hypothetical protein VG777_00255, partial [Thermoanaerobaculia bacterium]|nr:hypothetical protein [Thermoanaerobaculia bacterium]
MGAAAVHAAVFAFLQRRFGAKGAFLFAAGTLAALAAAGGIGRATALAVLAATGVLFAAVGDRAARKLLPDESLSFGVRIGIGMALFSWAASVALFFGIFTPIFLAALFAVAVLFGTGSFRRVGADFRAFARETAARWNGASAAGL